MILLSFVYFIYYAYDIFSFETFFQTENQAKEISHKIVANKSYSKNTYQMKLLRNCYKF